MGISLSDKLSGISMPSLLDKRKRSTSHSVDSDIQDVIKILPGIDSDRCLSAKQIIALENKISKIEARIASSNDLSNEKKAEYNHKIDHLWNRINAEKEVLLPVDQLSLKLYNLEDDFQYNDNQKNHDELQSIKHELKTLQQEQQLLRKQYGKQLFNYQLSNNSKNFSNDEIEKINQITNYDLMIRDSDIEQRIKKIESQLKISDNQSIESTNSFYSPKSTISQQNTKYLNSPNTELSGNNLPTSLKS